MKRRPKKSRTCFRRAWQAAALAHLGAGLRLAVFWAAMAEITPQAQAAHAGQKSARGG